MKVGRHVTGWAMAFFMVGTSPAFAQLPNLLGKKEPTTPTEPATTDIVARVNGEPITRQQLADELIEMHGRDHLGNMISRRLVEQQCRQKNVTITQEDLRKELDDFLARNNLREKEFREQVLAAQGLTLNQYLRDQVWPKLALLRLVEGTVQVSEEDLTRAFEANFGEKVDCRMITVVERRKAEEIWRDISAVLKVEDKVKAFEDLARRYSTDEATRPYGGQAVPIGRHTTHQLIEEAAFGLQPGDLSSIMQVPGGNMILLCVSRIPAQEGVTLDSTIDHAKVGPSIPKEIKTYRELFTKDIEQKKLIEEVKGYFETLEKNSKVENFLTGEFGVDAVIGSAPSQSPPPRRSGN